MVREGFYYKHGSELIEIFSKLLLLITLISIFVPFAPKMPTSGLDPSWALGLNQAVAQGLAFGKEIIFTLGPYSSIYTKSYHPATDLLMIAGSLYLAIFYWIGLIILMKNKSWYWFLAYCAPLFVMIYARDSLFFSYPLLVGLITFNFFLFENRFSSSNKYSWFFVFLLFTPFGLLALIKSSMLILCLMISFLCFTFFLINKRIILALTSIAAPLVSIILFWICSGQSLFNLPLYFFNTFNIASGFTEAMSSDGNKYEIIIYLINSSLIFTFILLQKHLSINEKIFLLSVFFAFLFLSFKTGFTRHFGHAFIPATSILLTTLFLPLIFKSRLTYLLIFLSLGSWHYIIGHYTQISLCNNFISFYSSVWYGFKSRVQDPFWLNKNFTLTMNFLKDQGAFPILPGTSDIYSYNQSYLISSHNIWSPRPVFQSYSVFTAHLAKDNRNHLNGKHAPDNIIFKIEPIDGRLPSLEDGASWPLLLANYKPLYLANSFLFLRKKESLLLLPKRLKKEQHLFGELVKVPKQKQPLFAKVEIKSTFLGKLALIFFKPEKLNIVLHLKNGTTKQYRLIANMANSNFLLSPLIENNTEFLLLYKKNSDLNPKIVKSFIISANQTQSWHWNNNYNIQFLS